MNAETTMQKQGVDGAEKLQQRPTVTPAVDVFENRDELLVLADLPGVDKDDLSIALEKSQLSIRGKRVIDGHAFDYARTFVVPNGIDADRISAELANGVLRLVLPKSAALKPRTIQVKAG
ncbi:MAG TPA: Hsp20/alpha crystallin family protein [Minicystis sp.]|nr:Hsp20/alpha crystallin family protein [Minicystis sp.]